MKIIRQPSEMRRLAARWLRQGQTIGFVPTMGALHRGHASLIERARRENQRLVVSIFVNPAQFGPNEDYNRYPHTFAADQKLCGSLRADALYHPCADQIYPEGFATFVEVGGLSSVLCGAFRPGHFKGVATIVLKLLQTVRPDKAYFGEKDFQQLVIVKKMVLDLDFSTQIIGCPTIREKDGLALSSRNKYLNPDQRAAAPGLYRALESGAKFALRCRRAASMISRVRREIYRIAGVSIDYAALVDENTLQEVRQLKKGLRLRLLAAIRLGKTRLIDNVPVRL